MGWEGNEKGQIGKGKETVGGEEKGRVQPASETCTSLSERASFLPHASRRAASSISFSGLFSK